MAMVFVAVPIALAPWLVFGNNQALAREKQIAVTGPANPTESEEPTPVESIGPEPVRAKINNSSASELEIPLEINANVSKMMPAMPVYISLDIPHHNNNTVSYCAVYPYPQPLPRIHKEVRALDTKLFGIKTLILQTAYSRKTMKTMAYPIGGWRWQAAYARALKRSGLDEPHILVNLYQFINDILPYCHEECKRSNEIEEKRVERFKRAEAEYSETRADTETEATRKGMVPLGVKYTKFFPNGVRQAVVKLIPGQWWVIATHKVPGLTYYWQEPLSVHPGEPAEIVLNEENALLIEGAW